ncbi:MAG: CCA tRNA nucleotidyltransferase [Eubacteriales bacterium]|nr:CCA tRNA nucleotidyltransferase [Eubacteriales bacterium]
MNKIQIPKNAATIIQMLNSHGHEAYVVGGCVRDSIIGHTPADWDITTSARPDQVKAIFNKTIDTGLKHGTITVMMGKEGYEVTTYRIGGVAEDPESLEVTFSDNLEEDLSHRDLTINAMAYHPVEGVVDLFGGLADIDDGVIRCVGSAEERFAEDPLRMLRVIRFSGQLNYKVDPAVMDAIRAQAQNLASVSKERIQMELLKMMISDHPEVIRTAYEAGLTKVFLPEFDDMMTTVQNNPHHCYTVGEHTIHCLMNISPNPILRLTMLFHDIGKPATKSTDDQGIDHFHGHYKVSSEMAASIMKRLKFDNNTIKLVTTLISFHDTRFSDPLSEGRRQLRKVLSKITPTLFPYLLDVMKADLLSQSEYKREQKMATLEEAHAAYEEIMANHDCLSLKELKINGNDLKALGIKDGKTIGSILKTLLTMVLENPELNNYMYLEELALRIYKQLIAE